VVPFYPKSPDRGHHGHAPRDSTPCRDSLCPYFADSLQQTGAFFGGATALHLAPLSIRHLELGQKTDQGPTDRVGQNATQKQLRSNFNV